MKMLYAVAGLLLVAAPAMAQGGGMGRMGPPPDHWMTFDSLVAAVGITDAQKADAQKHYDAINAILKDAAAKRAEMRGQMSGPPTDEQRQQMRDAMQKTRSDVETHYNELRGVLTADQQTKFDALPKPPYMGMMMRQRPPGM
jgi:Spy/CpxP family protein refolding chaperone